jgi:hypothetical protein
LIPWEEALFFSGENGNGNHDEIKERSEFI